MRLSGLPSRLSDSISAAKPAFEPSQKLLRSIKNKMAVFALGQLGDRDGADALRRALVDRDADVRWNAAIALARVGDASGEPVLIEMLERFTTESAPKRMAADPEDDSPALNAIRALSLLRGERPRAALERAARSAKSEEIRGTARLALESRAAPASRTSP